MLVDGFAMKLVMKPQQYDVVVTTNQFGDILTDEGAGLVGGLGLAPGLCVGDAQAMAQATHGSAPDIAGKNIANPYAMIMSGQDAVRMAGPQARRTARGRRRGAHRSGGRARDRRSAPSDRPISAARRALARWAMPLRVRFDQLD